MPTLKVNSELVNAIRKEVLNTIYPINSIYITTGTDDPSSYLGGKWEHLYGAFLYAAQGRDNVRGERKNGQGTLTNDHSLTIDQIPSHNHTGSTDNQGNHNHSLHLTTGSGSNQSYFRVAGSGNVDWGPQTWVGGYSNWAGGHTHSFTTGNRGGSGGHSHNIPFIAVIVWRRTA